MYETARTGSRALLCICFDIIDFLNNCFYSFAYFPLIEARAIHLSVFTVLSYDTNPAKNVCHMECFAGQGYILGST